MQSIYDFKVRDINGNEVSLEQFKGKVLLVVNTASKCGFTKQYGSLEELYAKYKDRGFEVLAFPCNQFAGQEPGDENEIKNFCTLNYNVTFPLFAKVNVNGEDAAPVYCFLKGEQKGLLNTEAIKWNFTKFLVGKNGEVIKRYAPITDPLSLGTEIEGLLNK